MEKDWLDRWPKDGPPIAWRGSIGRGFSAVSVAKDRLFTMGHKDGKDTVYCLDALTGKPLWSHSYEAALGDLNFEGGPTATPTVADGAVYTLSRWGKVFCFDAANGTVRWSKDLRASNNVRVPGWGFSSSPLIHENLVVLNIGKAGMRAGENQRQSRVVVDKTRKPATRRRCRSRREVSGLARSAPARASRR